MRDELARKRQFAILVRKADTCVRILRRRWPGSVRPIAVPLGICGTELKIRFAKKLMAEWVISGRTRARTWDPLIKSQLLYQLSYAPERRVRPCEAGRLAKQLRDGKRTGEGFPRVRPGGQKCEKPPDSSGFARVDQGSIKGRSGESRPQLRGALPDPGPARRRGQSRHGGGPCPGP
jgi:hypothetical protein